MIRSISRLLSWFAVFACAVCAPLSLGQTNGAPYSSINIDYAHQDEPFSFSTFQLNNSYLRAYTYLDGSAYTSSTNCVPVFSYKLNDSSKYYTPVTGTVVGSYLLFNFTPAHLAVSGSAFPSIVTVTDTNLNQTWDFMNGRMTVKQSYINGGLVALLLRGSVNWDTLNNLGTVPWPTNSLSYTGDVQQAFVHTTIGSTVAVERAYATNQFQAKGTYATGTPVYAESDPVFTNWIGTNAVQDKLNQGTNSWSVLLPVINAGGIVGGDDLDNQLSSYTPLSTGLLGVAAYNWGNHSTNGYLLPASTSDLARAGSAGLVLTGTLASAAQGLLADGALLTNGTKAMMGNFDMGGYFQTNVHSIRFSNAEWLIDPVNHYIRFDAALGVTLVNVAYVDGLANAGLTLDGIYPERVKFISDADGLFNGGEGPQGAWANFSRIQLSNVAAVAVSGEGITNIPLAGVLGAVDQSITNLSASTAALNAATNTAWKGSTNQADIASSAKLNTATGTVLAADTNFAGNRNAAGFGVTNLSLFSLQYNGTNFPFRVGTYAGTTGVYIVNGVLTNWLFLE